LTDEDELKDEIAELKQRIGELEFVLSKALEPLSWLNSAAGNYMRLMDVYSRFGSISPDVLVPGVKDPISTEIINVLAKGKQMNVSQLTDAVRDRRGTASRRIVRERLAELVEKDIVEKSGGQRPTYKLTEEVVRKWAEVLGFIK